MRFGLFGLIFLPFCEDFGVFKRVHICRKLTHVQLKCLGPGAAWNDEKDRTWQLPPLRLTLRLNVKFDSYSAPMFCVSHSTNGQIGGIPSSKRLLLARLESQTTGPKTN